MKSKTLLVLLAALLLILGMEPAHASDTNYLMQTGNDVFTASWLCTLNNKLCTAQTNNPDFNDNSRFVDGGIFNVINDVLDNHVADVNVRIFKYRLAKNGDNSGYASGEVKRLNDEISDIQASRKILSEKLNAGIINPDNYVFAVKQLERREKYNEKQANELGEITGNVLKDEKLSNDFKKISKTIEDKDRKDKNGGNNGKEIVSGTKGNENAVVNDGKVKTEGVGNSGDSKGTGGVNSEGNTGSSGKGGGKSGGGDGGKSGGNGGGSSGSSSGGSGGNGGGSSGSSSGGSGGSGGGSSGSSNGGSGGNGGGSSGSSSGGSGGNGGGSGGGSSGSSNGGGSGGNGGGGGGSSGGGGGGGSSGGGGGGGSSGGGGGGGSSGGGGGGGSSSGGGGGGSSGGGGGGGSSGGGRGGSGGGKD